MKINDAESALRSYVETLRLPLSAHVRPKLRQRVCRYVDALKDDGTLPERVIVQVKDLVRDCADVPPIERRVDEFNRLVVDLIGWCIERYYVDVIAARTSKSGWRGQRGFGALTKPSTTRSQQRRGPNNEPYPVSARARGNDWGYLQPDVVEHGKDGQTTRERDTNRGRLT
jgi:hypothetical protein